MRLALAILLSVSLLSAHARRQKTTIKGQIPVEVTAKSSQDTDAPCDTITTRLDSLIALAGYDKPLTASRETLHVTNLSADRTIESVTLEITYLDRHNRQLHKRQATLKLRLAPGETTLAGFPTWDTQRSFYYILSVKPRRQATPYSVAITPISATILTTTNL
ncbi:MAG: hypothetical protein K2J06_00525 [Muribaculaceae bacterium]|nr:hypothetical protein [Muribaculaceae bacterium]